VIKAQQMKDCMDQEAPELLVKSVPQFTRLTPGCLHRDDHIAN
jgi:hypothetical protein